MFPASSLVWDKMCYSIRWDRLPGWKFLVLRSVFLHVEVSVILVRVFFGIATGFLERFRAGGGGSVAIPGIHVLKGYIGYYGPLVLRPQCVA